MMSNAPRGVIYIGVTTDLEGRASEHRQGIGGWFTKKYKCRNLVWYERHPNVIVAINREKRLKQYFREWKINLIERFTPNWSDLSGRTHLRDNPFKPHRFFRNAKHYD